MGRFIDLGGVWVRGRDVRMVYGPSDEYTHLGDDLRGGAIKATVVLADGKIVGAGREPAEIAALLADDDLGADDEDPFEPFDI